MNDNQVAPATKPRCDVFVVENWTNAEGAEQANWIRVGVAFKHRDGKGFNVELKAIPVGGKLVIRDLETKAPA